MEASTHGSLPDAGYVELSGDTIPALRECHPLTLISANIAVLFGGQGEDEFYIFGDCWILDLAKAKSLQEDSSSIRTRCRHHEGPDPWGIRRQKHATVLEPYSKRLWIIGGSYNFEDEEVQGSDPEGQKNRPRIFPRIFPSSFRNS